jgi:hypothetical protein
LVYLEVFRRHDEEVEVRLEGVVAWVLDRAPPVDFVDAYEDRHWVQTVDVLTEKVVLDDGVVRGIDDDSSFVSSSSLSWLYQTSRGGRHLKDGGLLGLYMVSSFCLIFG